MKNIIIRKDPHKPSLLEQTLMLLWIVGIPISLVLHIITKWAGWWIFLVVAPMFILAFVTQGEMERRIK